MSPTSRLSSNHFSSSRPIGRRSNIASTVRRLLDAGVLRGYSGFGFAGVHAGFDDKLQFGRTDLMEVDGYFTRGDLNLQGQLSYGRQGANGYNGYSSDKSTWYGFSVPAM